MKLQCPLIPLLLSYTLSPALTAPPCSWLWILPISALFQACLSKVAFPFFTKDSLQSIPSAPPFGNFFSLEKREYLLFVSINLNPFPRTIVNQIPLLFQKPQLSDEAVCIAHHLQKCPGCSKAKQSF